MYVDEVVKKLNYPNFPLPSQPGLQHFNEIGLLLWFAADRTTKCADYFPNKRIKGLKDPLKFNICNLRVSKITGRLKKRLCALCDDNRREDEYHVLRIIDDKKEVFEKILLMIRQC